MYGFSRAGETDSHRARRMTVNRLHESPDVPSVPNHSPPDAAISQRIDERIPFRVNCRLAPGEAACNGSKQLARFDDDTLDELQRNRAHFSDIVTYAVRTAK